MYTNVPEVVICAKYLSSLNITASMRFEHEFGSYRGTMGLYSDEVRSQPKYKELNMEMNRTFQNLQKYHVTISKDKDYVAYRKAWRSKTMMQPAIRACYSVARMMFIENSFYDYETFKEKYLAELKKEYVEKYGEL